MSPVVTLVVGALLYYVAVTGRFEAVYRAMTGPAPGRRKGQQDAVEAFFTADASAAVKGSVP